MLIGLFFLYYFNDNIYYLLTVFGLHPQCTVAFVEFMQFSDVNLIAFIFHELHSHGINI